MADTKEDRPPYVRFERRAIEDRAASIAAGHYVARDVDFVKVTPMGSKDCFEQETKDWLAARRQDSREGRFPPKWLDDFEQAYQRWLKGEELPTTGTPIKGWGLASPALQASIISANILTVEDLAQANAEALGRIGMGAVPLKQKAEAWLKAHKDIGPVVEQNSAMRVTITGLEKTVEDLQRNCGALQARLDQYETRGKATEFGNKEVAKV